MNNSYDIFTIIRHGRFHGDEFRIPCELNQVAEIRTKTGGIHSWNEELGDYIRVTKESESWMWILKMKS